MSDLVTRPRNSNIWERESDDFYMEPQWTSVRLFQTRTFRPGMTVLDPACGTGSIVKAACEAGMHGLGSDIVPRWLARPGSGIYLESNFLAPTLSEGGWPARQTPGWQFPDAIVSNPPFKHAQWFAELALERAVSIVALLLPTKWLHGATRAKWLSTTPLHRVWLLTPRPSMPPGHVILEGGKAGSGTVDFAWMVWLKGYDGAPQIGWLNRDVRPD
ncbi:MAG: hypothetical protein EA385_15190 [Salinarimonadaceae bacterium]|nr:MAG: hypothetical protein EA385_15190 [Salinarimonadaceae bacterium]